MSTAPVLPRDARLIALILAAAGAQDWEEGVVRMLVEFAHRYTTDVLSDSLMYAEHARSGQSGPAAATPLVPSLDDIRLAVQARTEGATVPKEFLLQLATTVNAVPLPSVPEVYGIRLPPIASRLTAPNFSLARRSTVIVPPPPQQQEGPEESDAGQEDESEGDGLFGNSGEEDESDEEMEDVTEGFGEVTGSNGEGGGEKRKAESDNEYDS